MVCATAAACYRSVDGVNLELIVRSFDSVEVVVAVAAEAGGLDPVAEDGAVERVARRATDNEVVKLERRGVARERRLLRLEAGAVSRSRVARAR